MEQVENVLKNKKRVARKVPSSFGLAEDYLHLSQTKQTYVDFLPKDKEILSKLSSIEQRAYKKKLLDEGRYNIVEGQKPVKNLARYGL